MEYIIKDLINDIQDYDNLNFKKEDELKIFFLIFFLNCIIENNNKFNNKEFLDFLFTEINEYCYDNNLEETGIFNFISLIDRNRIKKIFDFKIPLNLVYDYTTPIRDNYFYSKEEINIQNEFLFNSDDIEEAKDYFRRKLIIDSHIAKVYYCPISGQFKVSYNLNYNDINLSLDCYCENINISNFIEFIEKDYFELYNYDSKTTILIKRIKYLRNYNYNKIFSVYENYIEEKKKQELKESNAASIRMNVIMQEYNKLFK